MVPRVRCIRWIVLLACLTVGSACGITNDSIARDEPQIRQPEPATFLTIERLYPGVNIRLEPPPADSIPTLTPVEAFNAYVDAVGGFAAERTKGPPDIRLGLYSNDTYGDLEDDGSVRLRHQNRLAWIISFRGIDWDGLGGPSKLDTASRFELAPDAPAADAVALIHPESGELIASFSDAPATAPVVTMKQDQPPPDVQFLDPLPASPSGPSVVFYFRDRYEDPSVSHVVNFECRMDQGPFEPCDSGATYSDLGPTSHTFTVTASDDTGQDVDPPSFTWQG